MRIALVGLVVGACAGGDYGDRCTENQDCTSALECWRVNDLETTGHCLAICRAENQFTCPDSTACVGPRDPNPKPCMPTCESDAECPDGMPTCVAIACSP